MSIYANNETMSKVFELIHTFCPNNWRHIHKLSTEQTEKDFIFCWWRAAMQAREQRQLDELWRVIKSGAPCPQTFNAMVAFTCGKLGLDWVTCLSVLRVCHSQGPRSENGYASSTAQGPQSQPQCHPPAETSKEAAKPGKRSGQASLKRSSKRK